MAAAAIYPLQTQCNFKLAALLAQHLKIPIRLVNRFFLRVDFIDGNMEMQIIGITMHH